MMGYKDRTFCPFSDCKNFGEGCSRSLTQNVQDEADEWWGEGSGEAPIITFVDPPEECYEPVKLIH